MSVEYTRTMKVRERTVWLTDHPGATVEDFDRERRPFNSVHGGQNAASDKRALSCTQAGQQETVPGAEQRKYSNMPIDMAKRALKLASRGLSVLPMHSAHRGRCTCPKGNACERAGKHPITPHGVNDATTKRDQIKSWWTASPDANIGIATGAASGVIVLDIDPRNGGTETLRRLEKELGPLPKTVTSITGGGGEHRIFEHPRFPVRKDLAGKLLGPGVDVLSNGCIMIAPPSRHASGNRYGWQEGKSFRDLKPAPMPKPWLDRLSGNTATQADADSSLTQPAGLVPQGQRNSHLTSLAGTLQRTGTSPEAITAALMTENAVKCTPPLHSSEVEKIVASVTTYPAIPLGDGVDAAESLMQLVLTQYFNGGRHLLLGTDNRFWYYDVRLWRPVPDQWVSGKVLEVVQANPIKGQKTASLIGQTLTLLKAKLAIKDDVLSFIVNLLQSLIARMASYGLLMTAPLNCGLINPSSYLRDCLDVAYDPKAECPEYDKALHEIFSKVEKPKRLVRHWNELAVC